MHILEYARVRMHALFNLGAPSLPASTARSCVPRKGSSSPPERRKKASMYLHYDPAGRNPDYVF